MAVCYVETFLLQNAFVDAGLLWLAALWRGGRIRPLRIASGAMLGAVWAVLAAMLGGALRSVPAQGAVSALMVWTGLGRAPAGQTAKSAGSLWAMAMVLGGAMTLGVPPVMAGATTGFAGMAMVRRKNTPPPPSVTLLIWKGTVAHALDAIVDTGNRALDPLTARPVVFVPEGLFDVQAERMLMIRTAAGGRLLPCFLPDGASVNGTPVQAMVAITPKGMLDGALVPWALCAERKVS